MVIQTAQQKKSEETIQKIYDATKLILQKYDNSVLTVRNICDVAGVSTGSFYHHFHTKEELMRRYTIDAYRRFCLETPVEFPEKEARIVLNEIIFSYYQFMHFCLYMGKEYVQQNIIGPNLDILRDPVFGDRLQPIFQKAAEEKCFQKLVKIPILLDDLSIIQTGLLARWCYGEDAFDLLQVGVRLMWIHLSSLVTDEYVAKHKEIFSGRFQ